MHGSNHSYDPQVAQLRSLDVEPTMHWLSLYLAVEHLSVPAIGDGTIALLLAAMSPSMPSVAQMARAALASSHAPERVQLVWLTEPDQQAVLAECNAASRALRSELATARRLSPIGSHAEPVVPLRCVSPSQQPRSLAERFALLAAATDAQVLMLCPRLVTSFGPLANAITAMEGGTVGGRGTPADTGSSASAFEAWDREARAFFDGCGDVRHYPKDRVLMLQAMPRASTRPAGHALVHRLALDHLGCACMMLETYATCLSTVLVLLGSHARRHPPPRADFGPPHSGSDWLLFTLNMQQMFGSVGRHRWLGNGRLHFEEAAAGDLQQDSGSSDAPYGGAPASSNASAGASVVGAVPPPAAGPSQLRQLFERSAGARAIDTHRLESLLLALKPKSRTAFEGATAAYAHFAELYDAGALAAAWPVLAEISWALEALERSDDRELRDMVGPSILPAAQDVQARLLDQYANQEMHSS